MLTIYIYEISTVHDSMARTPPPPPPPPHTHTHTHTHTQIYINKHITHIVCRYTFYSYDSGTLIILISSRFKTGFFIQLLTETHHLGVIIGCLLWVISVCPAFNTLRPRQNGRHCRDNTLNTFYWIKMLKFRFKFHWSLFLKVQLSITQHCFR